MEGVTSEAASVAGHLGLSNLTMFYDNNHITIEGHTSLAFTDDVGQRFEAYGMEYPARHRCERPQSGRRRHARAHSGSRIGQPSLSAIPISGGALPTVRTPRKPTARRWESTEVRKTKIVYGWPPDRSSCVPMKLKPYMGKASRQRRQVGNRNGSSGTRHTKAAQDPAPPRCGSKCKQELPDGWDKDIPTFPADAKGLATRDSSAK